MHILQGNAEVPSKVVDLQAVRTRQSVFDQRSESAAEQYRNQIMPEAKKPSQLVSSATPANEQTYLYQPPQQSGAFKRVPVKGASKLIQLSGVES